MERQNIPSGSIFEERYGHSRAVVVGNTVYVAGTTGYDYKTKQMSDDEFNATIGAAIDGIYQASIT